MIPEVVEDAVQCVMEDREYTIDEEEGEVVVTLEATPSVYDHQTLADRLAECLESDGYSVKREGFNRYRIYE